MRGRRVDGKEGKGMEGRERDGGMDGRKEEKGMKRSDGMDGRE